MVVIVIPPYMVNW